MESTTLPIKGERDSGTNCSAITATQKFSTSGAVVQKWQNIEKRRWVQPYVAAYILSSFGTIDKKTLVLRKKHYMDTSHYSVQSQYHCIIIYVTASNVTTSHNTLTQWFQFPQEP